MKKQLLERRTLKWNTQDLYWIVMFLSWTLRWDIQVSDFFTFICCSRLTWDTHKVVYNKTILFVRCHIVTHLSLLHMIIKIDNISGNEKAIAAKESVQDGMNPLQLFIFTNVICCSTLQLCTCYFSSLSIATSYSIKETNWLINKKMCVLLSAVFKHLRMRKSDILKTCWKSKFLGKKIWRNTLTLKSKKVQGILVKIVYFGITFSCFLCTKPRLRFLLKCFSFFKR